MAGRFIKLYDKILNWEWYSDINTCRLFIHLLLKANYKDVSFQGIVVHRGQMATSLTSLASQTCLSIRQVRDSLDKLKMTGELTSSSYPRFRIITIIHYDEYQSDGKVNGSLMTSNTAGSRQAEGQANDRQTDKQTGNKYRTIEDRTIEDRNIESLSTRERSAKRFVPPSPDDVRAYCQENGIQIDADRFVDYYSSKGWLVGKSPMKDWKAAIRGWAKRDREQQTQTPAPKPVKMVIAQDYEQRDYSGNQEYWENQMRERIMERRRRQNENT